MSTEIEQRIVEMKFDRQGFANGVQDTLKDLDKLDKGMQLNGGRQGLAHLQQSINAVQFNSVLAGIQNIQDSLNQMQSFGFQVFKNLTSKATDWAVHMVKSLSVDQIAGGFSEYELKMDSVRTIMSSSGKDIDEVNKYLEELNEYSDKTIYSFSDMTASIGKFTNAGVDLDKAVMAIKGISSEAALAGAGTQQASAAMYNFSQALSSGAVKLIDWKSIENANMATKEFKQELIDTAVALGTVVKTENGYITKTAAAAGKTDEVFDSVAHFNDYLKDEWMTSDVLIETLSRYADETTDIGARAMAAAQEVTTYSKMMDALKEQVGSGWAQTFEILFGNLEEAKVLWTNVNEVVGGFIQGVSDTRNGILKMWKLDETGGAISDLMDSLGNIYKIVRNIGDYIGLALETIFGHRYLQNFEDVKEFFEGSSFSGNLVTVKRLSGFLIDTTKRFKSFTDTLYSFFDISNKENVTARHLLEEIYQAAQAIIIPLRFVFQIFSGLISKILPVFAKGIAGAARVVIFMVSRLGYAFTEGHIQEKLYKIADLIVNGVGKGINYITGLLGKLFGFFNKTDGFYELGEKIQPMINNFIGKPLDWVISVLEFITEKTESLPSRILPVIESISNGIKSFKKQFKQFWTKTLKPAIDQITDKVPDMAAQVLGALSSIWNMIVPIAKSLGGTIGSAVSFLVDKFKDLFIGVLNNNGFKNFSEFVSYIGENAVPLLKKGLDDIVTGFKYLLNGIKKVKKALKPFYKTAKNTFFKIGRFIDDSGFIDNVSDRLKGLSDNIKKWFKDSADDSTESIEEVNAEIDKFVKKGMTIEDATKKVKHMNGDFEDLGGMMDWVGGKFEALGKKITNSKFVTMIKDFVEGLVTKVKNNSIIKTITESGFIKNVKELVDNIIDAAKNVFSSSNILDSLREFGSIITDLVGNLSSVEFSSIDSIISGVSDSFNSFNSAINNFSIDKFAEIQEAIKKFWAQLKPSKDPKEETEIQKTIYERFSNIITSAVGGLVGGIANLNWENVLNIIKGLFGIKILFSLSKIFGKGEKAAKGLDKFTDILGNSLEKITEVFTLSKWTILANAFYKFAQSVVYLVAGITVLAMIPQEDLDRALMAIAQIAGIFLAIYAVKAIVDRFIGSANKTKSVSKKASDAIDGAKGALNTFVDNTKAFFDAVAIGAKQILAKIGNAFIIVSLGIAVLMIIGAVGYLSKLLADGTESFDRAFVRILWIVGLVASFAAALMAVDKWAKTNIGDYVGLAIMILVLIHAVDEFVKVYEVFKDIKETDFRRIFGEWASIVVTIAGVAAALIWLVTKFGVGVIKANSVFKNIIKTIVVCVLAIIALSRLSGDQIQQGVLAIGEILGLIWLFTWGMSKISSIGAMGGGGAGAGLGNVPKLLLSIAAGFVAVAASFWIFSKAVETMVNAAPMLRKYSDEFLNMVLIFAVAATAVITIGIAFGMLSTVGALVGPIILMIAGAVALVGLAFFLAGNGMKAAAEAAVIFAENMDKIILAVQGREEEVKTSVQAIVSAAVKGIADGLAYLGRLIAGWLWNLLVEFDDNALVIGTYLSSSLTKLLVGLVHGILKGIMESIPFVGETFATWVEELAEGSQPDYDKLAADAKARGDIATYRYMKDMADKVREEGEQVQKAYGDTADLTADIYKEKLLDRTDGKSPAQTTEKAMSDSEQAIKDKEADLVNAAGTAGTNTGNAYGFNVFNAVSLSTDTVKQVLPPQLQGALDYAGNNADWTSVFGNAAGAAEAAAGNTSDSYIEAIMQKVNSSADGTGYTVDNTMAESMDTYKGLIGDQADSITESEIYDTFVNGDYEKAAEMVDKAFAGSMDENSKVIEDSATTVTKEGVDAADSYARANSPVVGDNLVRGMGNSVIAGEGWFAGVCGNFVRAGINNMRVVADEHSPSKETYQIGAYIVLGLLNAVKDNGDSFVRECGTLMDTTLDALRSSMFKAFQYFDTNAEYNPVISPVIDSSGIQYGIQNMKTLMSGVNYTPYVTPNVRLGQVDVGSAVGELSAATTQGNSDLLSQLQLQARQTERLIYLLENQKLYLDGKTLIGKTISDIDTALGKRAVLAGGRR